MGRHRGVTKLMGCCYRFGVGRERQNTPRLFCFVCKAFHPVRFTVRREVPEQVRAGETSLHTYKMVPLAVPVSTDAVLTAVPVAKSRRKLMNLLV